jgi:hypothetical protein
MISTFPELDVDGDPVLNEDGIIIELSSLELR